MRHACSWTLVGVLAWVQALQLLQAPLPPRSCSLVQLAALPVDEARAIQVRILVLRALVKVAPSAAARAEIDVWEARALLRHRHLHSPHCMIHRLQHQTAVEPQASAVGQPSSLAGGWQGRRVLRGPRSWVMRPHAMAAPRRWTPQPRGRGLQHLAGRDLAAMVRVHTCRNGSRSRSRQGAAWIRDAGRDTDRQESAHTR